MVGWIVAGVLLVAWLVTGELLRAGQRRTKRREQAMTALPKTDRDLSGDWLVIETQAGRKIHWCANVRQFGLVLQGTIHPKFAVAIFDMIGILHDDEVLAVVCDQGQDCKGSGYLRLVVEDPPRRMRGTMHVYPSDREHFQDFEVDYI